MGILHKHIGVFVLCLSISIFLIGCQKKEEEKCRIIYQVTEQNATPLTFRISYVGSNGETIVKEHTGIIFTSEEIERERQDYVSITVECQENSGSFDIVIFKNSVPFLYGEMFNPSIPVTVMGNLPQ